MEPVLEKIVASSKEEDRTEIIEDDPKFKEISLIDYIKSSHEIFGDPFRGHPQGLCTPSFTEDGVRVESLRIHYYPNVIANCIALNLVRSKKIARYYIQFIVEHERQRARQNPDIMSALREAEWTKILGVAQTFESYDKYQHRFPQIGANRAALRAIIRSIRESKKS